MSEVTGEIDFEDEEETSEKWLGVKEKVTNNGIGDRRIGDNPDMALFGKRLL